LSSGADCTVIDCEDGVAMNRKQEARENIHNLLNLVDLNKRLTVRINSVQSQLADEDMKFVFNCANKPECIFVPKTDDVDQVKWIYEKVNTYSSDSQMKFFFYMESGIGLINLKDIIYTALDLTRSKYNSRFSLQGFVFGSDDYCADVGAARTHDAIELLYARQHMVTICKAFKLQAVDMVYIDFKGEPSGIRPYAQKNAYPQPLKIN
jgi:citrate lyase subunit beta-like protein